MSGTPLVNKTELADALRCSLPTLDKLIRRHPDFPVVTAGRNGVEWEFDLPAVVDFLRAIDAERVAAGAARDELLAQYTLPNVEPEDQRGFKPQDLLALTRNRILQREEAKQAGFLVETHEVRSALTTAFTRLNRAMTAAIRQACRDANLPDPVGRSIEARFAEAQRQFVAATAAFLQDGPPPGSAADAPELPFAPH